MRSRRLPFNLITLIWYEINSVVTEVENNSSVENTQFSMTDLNHNC